MAALGAPKSLRDNASQAEMLVKAGAHLAVLNFNTVIETGGSPMTMADQIRRGVAWVFNNARSFGGDPERIYVSGHSSGGHWVLLTTDWQKEFGVPSTIIKGGVAGSGMFDLKPVRLSTRSNYVKFTDEAEGTLSAPSAILTGWSLWSAEPPRPRNSSAKAATSLLLAK